MARFFHLFLKKIMKEKLFDPAGNNENSPAPGMAAVNTFNEGEKEPENVPPQQVQNKEEMKPDNLHAGASEPEED